MASVALALLLPTILIVGLGARRANETAFLAVQPENSAPTKAALWHNRTMRSDYGSDPNAPQNTYVIVSPERELNEPDLLIYWVTGPVKGDSLPEASKAFREFCCRKRSLPCRRPKIPEALFCTACPTRQCLTMRGWRSCHERAIWCHQLEPSKEGVRHHRRVAAHGLYWRFLWA